MKSFLGTLVAIAILISGCAQLNNPYYYNTFYGATAGTAVGAGTGALVGSLISGGNVANSAWLGAGAGLVTGALAGAAATYQARANAINDNNDRIANNFEVLQSGRAELDQQREELLRESLNVRLDRSRHLRLYLGPTIGVMR